MTARSLKAKRVLFVSPCADIGGAEMSLLVLLAGLDRTRYEPIVITPQDGDFTERVRHQEIETVVFNAYPLMVERQLAQSLGNSVQSVRQLGEISRMIKVINPALIHVNSYRIGLPFSFAAQRQHVPTIWHVRDIPESHIKRRLLTSVLALPTRAVAISHAVERALGMTERANARLIYNGVQIERFMQPEKRGAFRQELGLDGSSILLCSIGQLIPWKGHDLLLRAFAPLARNNADLHLAIVGGAVAPAWADRRESETYPRFLRDLAQELNIDNQVTFTGFRNDIPTVMNDSDLYVHAARSPEPFGRVLVEAMAARRIVVAPDWGGIPEIVCDGKTGFLYMPNSADSLTATLQNALNCRTEWPKMGAAGLARAQDNFPAERYVTAMMALFDEVAK